MKLLLRFIWGLILFGLAGLMAYIGIENINKEGFWITSFGVFMIFLCIVDVFIALDWIEKAIK